MANLMRFLPPILMPRSVLVGEIGVLVARGRFDDADRLARHALRRYRDDADVLEAYAYSAHNSGRFAFAKDCWERLRRVNPGRVMAWAGVACNLRELGRADEATAIVVEAIARFPGDMILLGEASRVFKAAAPCEEHRDLMASVAAAHPDDPAIQAMYVEVLLAHGDLDRADERIAALVRQFPDLPDGSSYRIEAAFARRDWKGVLVAADELARRFPTVRDHAGRIDTALHQLATMADNLKYRNPLESLNCMEIVLRLSPDNPDWLALRIEALVRLGRLDEAGRDLATVETRFPDHRSVSITSATYFLRRERYDDAIAVMQPHLERNPSDTIVSDLVAQIRYERNHASEPAAKTRIMPAPQDVGSEDDAEKHSLLMTFESIGHDCEFGLVQRRYKAEPIGLFRWSATQIERLIPAFEAKLEGVGTPEHTLLSTWEDIEYFVADRRWGFDMHTFVTKRELEHDILYPKMCKRLAYLRDKFLADMKSGEKTFVFKSDEIRSEELARLHAALRVDAPVRLLCVKQQFRAPSCGREIEGGDVFHVAEGLFIGYVRRFGYSFPKWDIAFDDWIAICANLDEAAELPFPAESL